MAEATGSQSIMPAALPLHYGGTTHTNQLVGVNHMYCHTQALFSMFLAMLVATL